MAHQKRQQLESRSTSSRLPVEQVRWLTPRDPAGRYWKMAELYKAHCNNGSVSMSWWGGGALGSALGVLEWEKCQ